MRFLGTLSECGGNLLLEASGEELRGVVGDHWYTSTAGVKSNKSPGVRTVNPNPTLRSKSGIGSDAAGSSCDVAGSQGSSAMRQCSSGWNSIAIVRLAGTQCAGGAKLSVHNGRTLRSSTSTKKGTRAHDSV